MNDLWQIPGMRAKEGPYYGYTCSKCGEPARNTYCEPERTRMLERRMCFTCDYWTEFEKKLERDYGRMTIICGNVYTPGNRMSGAFRGMAGRRFDIEYLKWSIYAGQRITTFDLWSGGTLPDNLRVKYPDTAKFLNGAERVTFGEGAAWDESDYRAETYPLPSSLKAIK